VTEKATNIIFPDSYKERIDEADLRLREIALGHAAKLAEKAIGGQERFDFEAVATKMLTFLKTGDFEQK
jgi:hypothetical protein